MLLKVGDRRGLISLLQAGGAEPLVREQEVAVGLRVAGIGPGQSFVQAKTFLVGFLASAGLSVCK